MDNDWLNRIGIILNFFAGFMLAPELIGIERLKRLELRIENKLSKVNQSLGERLRTRTEFLGFLGSAKIKPFWLGLIVLSIILVALGLLPLGYYKFSACLLLLAYIFLVYLSIEHFRWLERAEAMKRVFFPVLELLVPSITEGELAMSKWAIIKKYQILLLLFPFSLSNTLVFSAVFRQVFQRILSLISFVVSFTVNKLVGEERLRALIVWLGIGFFILGNLFQLIGTFKWRI